MRIVLVAASAAVLLMLSGCYVQSVYPLYTEDELTFDPGLVGKWADPEEPEEPIIFDAVGENAYEITFVESDATVEYEGRLVRLGESVFLDLFPAEARLEDCTDDFVPVHLILWIQRDGDELRAAMISEEWLGTQIDGKKTDLDHFRYDGRIILAAETKQLQQAVVEFAGTEGAFEEPSLLRRVN